jgi:hypothetical protein
MKFGANKNSRYKQGYYHPVNKDKYNGKIPVVYRSSWELAAFWWLDNHKSCISWSSESLVVSYIFRNEKHRYFVDLCATIKSPDDTVKKYFIEIKPYKYTIPPQPSPRKRQKTLAQEAYMYAMNKAKWEAARETAKRRGAEFLVLTEKNLFKKKGE